MRRNNKTVSVSFLDLCTTPLHPPTELLCLPFLQSLARRKVKYWVQLTESSLILYTSKPSTKKSVRHIHTNVQYLRTLSTSILCPQARTFVLYFHVCYSVFTAYNNVHCIYTWTCMYIHIVIHHRGDCCLTLYMVVYCLFHDVLCRVK